MMPVIMPLNIPTAPLTEYQNERKRFAEMEVEFRARKRRAAILSLMGAVRALARRPSRAAQAHRAGRARAALG
ncbi:MAG: hypothetical protein NXH97_03725 [Rhodobacteraceae bacterium]|nr:hypothetical protein [Paracoccaceae bacterium]